MGVNTTFLNGLIEEVYIKQPRGFEIDNHKTHVCGLKKELFELKQAPRAWYGRIDGFLMSLGFTKSKEDFDLYYKVQGDGIMILILYVNELFFIGEDIPNNKFRKNIVAKFELNDLGMMHYFLGIEVWQYPDEI